MATIAVADGSRQQQTNGDQPFGSSSKSGGQAPSEVQQFMNQETNEDMRRMINATIGRLATPKEKQKVARSDFADYLKDKQVKDADCWNFPFVILYFVMFAVTVLLHEDIPNVSQVERLMRGMMEGTGFEGIQVSGHKSLDDIDLVVDIWTFLKDAAVPWFIPDLSAVQAKDLNRVMRYNQLIGGVQLQQIRRKKVACIDEYPHLGPFTSGTNTNPLLVGFSCYPWDSTSNDCFGTLGCTPANSTGACEGFCPDEKTSTSSSTSSGSSGGRLRLLQDGMYERVAGWGRRLASAHNAAKVKGQASKILSNGPKDFDGGVYTVTLHEHQGIQVAQQKLQSLQSAEWIDTATSWFGLKVFVLNPDLAVFTHMIVNVFMPPSGQLLPQVTIQSFPAEPYQSASKMAADFIWLCLWLHLTIQSVAKFVVSIMGGRCLHYAADVWTWLNWLCVIGGLVIICLWLVFLSRLQKIKDMAMAVVLNRPTPGASSPFPSAFQEDDYLKNTASLHNEAAQMSGFLMWCRLCICWYTILIMFRFFQAFKAQPRLAVVTNTITRSLTDLAHFIVVSLTVMMAFTVAGMFLFGHRLLEFSELSTAINTCFLIMIGDFDFAELAAEHPFTAVLWFWSFTILVAQILLNMLLAIIMDIYTEVKCDASEQDPIWTQIYKNITDAWSNRDWITLKAVSVQVAHLPSKVTEIDKDLLLELCPEMVEAQAMRLISETLDNIMQQENKGMAISDAMKMVGWIKIAVQKIAQRIEGILMIENEEKKILEESGMRSSASPTDGPGTQQRTAAFDPAADQKMLAIDQRLRKMETFLNESMCFSVYRAKEMRNRLNVIEDLLKGQENVLANSTPGTAPASDEWDAPPSFQLYTEQRAQPIAFSA